MQEALEAVFPATTLQTCVVHLIRSSLDYASWKDRRALAAALKPVYTAATMEQAVAELDAFEAGAWGQRFPMIGAAGKLLWLALRNITAEWGRATCDWRTAMNQFAILYADRFTKTAA